MMELANQLQLKSPVPDDLAPYLQCHQHRNDEGNETFRSMIANSH
jgi:hypothetical protein